MAISVSGAGYCGDVGRMEVGYVCSGLSRGGRGGRRGGCATGFPDAVVGDPGVGSFHVEGGQDQCRGRPGRWHVGGAQ